MIFTFFLRSLRPLRLRSGHALRPFGRVYPELSRRAQDMLCGRYSDSFGCDFAALGLGGENFFTRNPDEPIIEEFLSLYTKKRRRVTAEFPSEEK